MPAKALQKPAEPRKRRTATEPHGRNRAAVEASISHLATGPEHSALLEACRTLADAIDADPSNDRLWQRYQQALTSLMEAAAGGGTDDFLEKLARLRAPLPNPTD